MIGFPMFVVVDVDAKVPLDERQRYAKAQQIQVHQHFAPKWGRVAGVRAATPDNMPRPGEIQIRLLDKPTLDGALGYHDCLPDGTPVVNIFVGLAKSFGQRWETVASHEVLETLGDPLLRHCVEMIDGFWDCEVCDRVEQDKYYITVDGVEVPVSNFNYPEAFEPPQLLEGVKYDYMGLSTAPNQVRPGGYAQKFDPQKGWVQIGNMSAYRLTIAQAGISRGSKRKKRYQKRSWFRRLIARLTARRLPA